MPLNLQDRSAVQTVFNAGVSVDNMSWWFWIKAGMGFTIGGGLVAIIWGALVWGAILGAALLFSLAHR